MDGERENKMNILQNFGIRRDTTGKSMAMAEKKEPYNDESFQKKENRDARFKELKEMGHTNLRKRSYGTQLMDPRYVSDSDNYRGPDLGRGNDYRHHFKNIYSIDHDHREHPLPKRLTAVEQKKASDKELIEIMRQKQKDE